MKYIIKPATVIFAKYIGPTIKDLVNGTTYKLYSMTTTRDGKTYVSVEIPRCIEDSMENPNVSVMIISDRFSFRDGFNFKYELPVHNGMCFKYEYTGNLFDGYETFSTDDMYVKYAINKDSRDGVFVIYHKISNSEVLNIPLFEGKFEYTRFMDPKMMILNRIKVDRSYDIITYSLVKSQFNKSIIAQIYTREDYTVFTRYMITDDVNEASTFTLSKYNDDYIVYTSIPSKTFYEKAGFSIARIIKL